MGSVKVDEIGVSVGRTERPNGLSVGSRSASDKKVVPRFIQDKIRIGWLIYRPDRRRCVLQHQIVVSSWTPNRWLATGISSSVHNTHTHTHTHTSFRNIQQSASFSLLLLSDLLSSLYWPWDPLSSLDSTHVSIYVPKQVDCNMCRFSKLLLLSFFFCKDGRDRLMKRASFSCCNFLCVVLAAAYLKSLVVLAIRLALFSL